MRKNVSMLILSLCLVIIMIFASCNGGNGGSSSTTPAPLYNVTGRWEVGGPGILLVLHLTQNADGSITGTGDAGGYGGTVTGTNVNNKIHLIMTYSDGMVCVFDGDVEDANNMRGRYSVYWDPNNPFQEDAWSATRS